jgi:hypothetical protein
MAMEIFLTPAVAKQSRGITFLQSHGNAQNKIFIITIFILQNK